MFFLRYAMKAAEPSGAAGFIYFEHKCSQIIHKLIHELYLCQVYYFLFFCLWRTRNRTEGPLTRARMTGNYTQITENYFLSSSY